MDVLRVERECAEVGSTEALGRGFSLLLRSGDVVTLTGDLGAGKTTFVRAVAGGLGVDERTVSSPTFVIVNRYEIAGRVATHTVDAGVFAVSHIDAYRLHGDDELDNVGWDRVMNVDAAAPGTVALIEWPERIGSALPRDVARVTIGATGVVSRHFTFEFPASWRQRAKMERFEAEAPRRCPKTGAWVAPGSAHYPFADARAQGSDLFGWLTEKYGVEKPITESGDDEGLQEP